MIRISVLCPTRGRPADLVRAADSLLASAAHPDGVEFLAAADPDDDAMTQAAAWLPPQVKVWTAPERYGYKRICEYFNALAAMATGEWCLLFNDDATMLTPGWDEIVRAEAPDGILWPSADYAPGINTFPLWPTAWTRHLGHVSLDQSTDMWIYEIGRLTGTQRRIPVSIHHEHIYGDATANDRDAVANVATFNTPEMQQARARDAEKIRELLAS